VLAPCALAAPDCATSDGCVRTATRQSRLCRVGASRNGQFFDTYQLPRYLRISQSDIPILPMPTVRTTVFLSNRSQAVRLPKLVALPTTVKEVDIIAIGDTRIITPAGISWDAWFDGPGVSDDFMVEREQPGDQKREAL